MGGTKRELNNFSVKDWFAENGEKWVEIDFKEKNGVQEKL